MRREWIISAFLFVSVVKNYLAPQLEALGRFHELRADAGFPGRVAGGGNDDVFGFRPGAMEVVRRDYGTDGVVAALHDRAGEVTDASYVSEQRVLRQKDVVAEIMRLDARETQGYRISREVGNGVGAGQ